MKTAAILYSGGMDSFTLLHELMAGTIGPYAKVDALTFNYGQRHEKEILYARKYCDYLGIDHVIVDMRDIGAQLLQGSALTSNAVKVPEGHYAEPSMRETVVPNRNMIMLALGIGYCVSHEINDLYIGVQGGVESVYPDSRPEFIGRMNSVLAIANYHQVYVKAPYIYHTKGQIATIGATLQVDYSRAWTCFNGREKPCGKCGACVKRMESMEVAGIVDPLEYEA